MLIDIRYLNRSKRLENLARSSRNDSYRGSRAMMMVGNVKHCLKKGHPGSFILGGRSRSLGLSVPTHVVNRCIKVGCGKGAVSVQDLRCSGLVCFCSLATDHQPEV